MLLYILAKSSWIRIKVLHIKFSHDDSSLYFNKTASSLAASAVRGLGFGAPWKISVPKLCDAHGRPKCSEIFRRPSWAAKGTTNLHHPKQNVHILSFAGTATTDVVIQSAPIAVAILLNFLLPIMVLLLAATVAHRASSDQRCHRSTKTKKPGVTTMRKIRSE